MMKSYWSGRPALRWTTRRSAVVPRDSSVIVYGVPEPSVTNTLSTKSHGSPTMPVDTTRWRSSLPVGVRG